MSIANGHPSSSSGPLWYTSSSYSSWVECRRLEVNMYEFYRGWEASSSSNIVAKWWSECRAIIIYCSSLDPLSIGLFAVDCHASSSDCLFAVRAMDLFHVTSNSTRHIEVCVLLALATGWLAGRGISLSIKFAAAKVYHWITSYTFYLSIWRSSVWWLQRIVLVIHFLHTGTGDGTYGGICAFSQWHLSM